MEVPVALSLVVAVLPYLGISLTLERELQLAAIYALIVAGFNLGYGFGGQLRARAGRRVRGWGVHDRDPLQPRRHGAAGRDAGIVAFAGLLGLISGLPGLRFSDWSLALVAFFLVILIPNITDLLSSQTGGVIGIPGISGPKLAGQALGANGFYVVTIVFATLVLLIYRNLVKSRYGHGLLVLKHGQRWPARSASRRTGCGYRRTC